MELRPRTVAPAQGVARGARVTCANTYLAPDERSGLTPTGRLGLSAFK